MTRPTLRTLSSGGSTASGWTSPGAGSLAGGALLYSPATGKAAVLVEREGNGSALEVAAVLGMRWPVGKAVSGLSLRGLKPLAKGGASWS